MSRWWMQVCIKNKRPPRRRAGWWEVECKSSINRPGQTSSSSLVKCFISNDERNLHFKSIWKSRMNGSVCLVRTPKGWHDGIRQCLFDNPQSLRWISPCSITLSLVRSSLSVSWHYCEDSISFILHISLETVCNTWPYHFLPWTRPGSWYAHEGQLLLFNELAGPKQGLIS
jgi:hypothetical protein